jgi:hypothetical protein
MHAYQSPAQTGWNGWTEPTHLPTFKQMHRDLIKAIDQGLATIPIRQQTVIMAALWDVDSWGLDILTKLPTNGRYDGFAECLVDFDQYHGSIECIRQGAAEALADDLLEKAFPQWRNIQEFGSAWEADPPDLN